MNQELEASRCQEPLELTPEARKAFADRQDKLIADARWPLTAWYNDKDFCRAYNTAVRLQKQNERLRRSLECIRERAEPFDGPGISNTQKRNAIGGLRWIFEEARNVLESTAESVSAVRKREQST